MLKIKTVKHFLNRQIISFKSHDILIENVEIAMKKYGAYLIDLGAKEAKTILETEFDENNTSWSCLVVDKKSILKIKKQIK